LVVWSSRNCDAISVVVLPFRIQDVDMKEIDVFIGDDIGYEWGEIHFYSSGAMTLAVDSQSGCSCDYYETPIMQDLEWCHTATKFYENVASAVSSNYFFTSAQMGEILMAARKAWDERQVHDDEPSLPDC
jgi:hypothetical protein